MRKNHLLFALLLMFVFVGTTLAQNDEGAARMDAMVGENLSAEKATNEKVVTANKTAEPAIHALKPIEKPNKIETATAPISANKVVKGDRIKKNLKQNTQEEVNKLGLGKLGIVGLILIIVGIILLIVFWPVGVIFTIIGLVLLLLELV